MGWLAQSAMAPYFQAQLVGLLMYKVSIATIHILLAQKSACQSRAHC